MSHDSKVQRRSLFDAFRRAIQGDSTPAAQGAIPSEAPLEPSQGPSRGSGANGRALPPPPRGARGPQSFSLARFYEQRESRGDGDTQLPHFELRKGLPDVATVAAYAEPIGPTRKDKA